MSMTVLAVIVSFVCIVLGAAWATVRFGSWPRLGIGVLGLATIVAIGSWAYTKRAEPAAAACRLPTTTAELGSVCGFKNPEDLQYVRSMNLIVVSEEGFGGRVLSLDPNALNTGPRVLWPADAETMSRWATQADNLDGDLGDKDCPFPSDPKTLWPHGLSALEPIEPTSPVRIAFVSHRVVNRALTDSIQLFDLSEGDAPFQWRGCLNLPEDVIGNDISFLDDGSLLATNFIPRGTRGQLERSVFRGG